MLKESLQLKHYKNVFFTYPDVISNPYDFYFCGAQKEKFSQMLTLLFSKVDGDQASSKKLPPQPSTEIIIIIIFLLSLWMFVVLNL